MMESATSQLPRLKENSDSMQKVDRIAWRVGFSLQSYGVDIGIRSNDEAALERVIQHLPNKWERLTLPEVDRVYSILNRSNSGANGRRQSFLYVDGLRLARSNDLEVLFTALESNLRIFVAEFAKDLVFVHAGVVGWKDQAIVIPGRSYSGKSTLVTELIRAGATYYSDEYAVIDLQGRVHPYTKPIELRPEGTYKQEKFDVGDLGGHIGTKPLPVGLVLMTHYKEGGTWRPRKLTAGKAVLEMLFNTVSARRDPDRALVALQRVAGTADVLKGTRGEARTAVPAIIKKLEARSNHRPTS